MNWKPRGSPLKPEGVKIRVQGLSDQEDEGTWPITRPGSRGVRPSTSTRTHRNIRHRGGDTVYMCNRKDRTPDHKLPKKHKARAKEHYDV